jgi:tetratricopeptide (TPR) repeat protein
MANKKNNQETEKKYSLPEENKVEKAIKSGFQWIAKNRKVIFLSIIGVIVVIGVFLTFKVINQNKKNEIVTRFFKANKEYSEKLKKGQFDLNTLGTTMKKLREIAEMSSSVEESLLARYYLGVLHYNIARSKNKNNHFIKAKDYWVIVAEHEDFEFAPQCILAIGSSYEQLQKPQFYRRAIEFYNIAIKRYPSTVHSFRALYKKGICYIKLNKNDLAVSTFKRIPKYLPNDKSAQRENIYHTMAQYYILSLQS